MGSQRVGHGVEIGDLEFADAEDDVPRLDSGELRRTPGTHAREPHSAGRFGHVGDGPQIGAVPAGGRYLRRLGVDGGEGLVAGGEGPRHVGHQ